MTNTDLKIGRFDYDNTRALFDGTVEFDRVNATFHSAQIVTEVLECMIRGH